MNLAVHQCLIALFVTLLRTAVAISTPDVPPTARFIFADPSNVLSLRKDGSIVVHVAPSSWPEGTKFDLVMRVDGGRAQTRVPAPSLGKGGMYTGEIVADTGTHVFEAAYVRGDTKANVSGWTLVVVDIVPNRSFWLDGQLAHAPHRRQFSGLPAIRSTERIPGEFKITLIGERLDGVQQSGQVQLAKLQLRLLPHVTIPEIPHVLFSVSYLTNRRGGQPPRTSANTHQTEAKLAQSDYAIVVTHAAWEASSGSLEMLIASFRNAATWLDVPEVLRPCLAELVDLLQGSSVVSFMHHELAAQNDQLLVEAARLAGVQAILVEPASLFPQPVLDDSPSLASVAGLIVPSNAACEHWKAYHAALPCYVVSPGVDPLPPEIERIPQSRSVVAFIGRLSAIKSPGIFIRVAAHLRRSWVGQSQHPRFVVLGDGQLLGPLRQLSRRFGLRVATCPSRSSGLPPSPDQCDAAADVLLYGWMEHKHIVGFLRKHVTLTVHPNLKHETFCIANVESMWAAVPVLSFGVGGVADYLRVGDSHGVVVTYEDVAPVQRMASAVQCLLADDSDTAAAHLACRSWERGERNGPSEAGATRSLRRIGQLAHDFIQSRGLTQENMIRSYAHLYTGLVSGCQVAEEG